MPRILLLSLGLVASMAVAVPAQAGDPVEVVTVRAGTASGADAPSAQPGNATQPTSVVDQAALDQYVAPTGNYDDACG